MRHKCVKPKQKPNFDKQNWKELRGGTERGNKYTVNK